MQVQKQGASPIVTQMKQDGVFGIFHMQTLRWKDRKPLVFVDLYSGSGKNSVDGELINGSPISVLGGITKAIRSSNTIPKFPWLIVFNDIAEGRATHLLPMNVEQWQSDNGIPVNSGLLQLETKFGHPVSIPIKYLCNASSDVVDQIKNILETKNAHFIMAIDPNGPKDAPWDELSEIWEKHKNRVELLFHVSATTLKRCAKAKEATGMNFAPMPDHISGLIGAFSRCGGWIRDSVKADQWTMVLISFFPPKHGWGKSEGAFHLIASDQGQAVIQKLSSTKSELLR